MSPLRVLYLIDSLASGGAQRQLVTLIGELDRQMIEPEVAVYHPLDHFRPDLESTSTPIHLIGSSGARDPRVAFRLARLLDRGRFDVVHAYLRTPGVLARVVRRGQRVIVSERNVDLGGSRRGVLLERLLAHRADALIANAEAVARHVEALVPAWRGRVYVVPNGIAWSDPTADDRKRATEFRGRFAGDGRPILLGAVGRVERQKNPHLLLDALGLLSREVRERLSVVWVGAWIDRALLAAVERRLEAEGLQGTVTFLEETRSIRSVILALDALVLPSRWEGFPNAVLEAQADGLPVIATDVGDVRAIVEDGATGWIVPVGDPDALRAALQKLVDTPPAVRAEMGRRGTAVRERYSADLLAARTLDVYRQVLGR